MNDIETKLALIQSRQEALIATVHSLESTDCERLRATNELAGLAPVQMILRRELRHAG